jgi:hypothetical protein
MIVVFLFAVILAYDTLYPTFPQRGECQWDTSDRLMGVY